MLLLLQVVFDYQVFDTCHSGYNLQGLSISETVNLQYFDWRLIENMFIEPQR
jgi:hypothetical protein